jgi:hypothetical protein
MADMQVKELNVSIQGTVAMLLQNGRMANPLDPMSKELKKITGKKKKTDDDHELMSRIEWYGGLYTTEDGLIKVTGNIVSVEQKFGRVCIPSDLLESALIQGGKAFRKGEAFKAGVFVDHHPLLVYDGPKDVEEMLHGGGFRDTRKVGIMGKSVMRTRVIFKAGWKLNFTISYIPSLLDEREVLEALEVVGNTKGIGTYRPKFGRFKVVA